MKLAKKKGQEKKGNKEKRKKHRDDEDIFYAAIQLRAGAQVCDMRWCAKQLPFAVVKYP